MLDRLKSARVNRDPFPHALIDGLFDDATYRALAETFPICPPASGPTGFTIHRGDAVFDTVIARQPAWSSLYETCNSDGFLHAMTTLFADEIARSALLPARSLRFVNRVESRADKERNTLRSRLGIAAADVFLRFDFMQGRDSYGRERHLDHRRRLVTMLLYFDAPSEETFRGGDLVLHDANGVPVRHIAPAENRAVLFPCSERSWHSVDRVRDCRESRRFVQVSLTGRYNLWPTAELSQSLPPYAKRGWRANVMNLFSRGR